MAEQSGGPVPPTAFEVEKSQAGGAVVLTVSGEVDMLTAPELAKALHAVPAALIVDLSKVEFLASAGMTILVSAHGEVVPPTRLHRHRGPSRPPGAGSALKLAFGDCVEYRLQPIA